MPKLKWLTLSLAAAACVGLLGAPQAPGQDKKAAADKEKPADEPKESEKLQAVASEASDSIEDLFLPANLQDPGFDTYVDLRKLATATRAKDAALLTDLALQLAEGERVLLRPHKALNSQQALQAALVIAKEKRDEASLKRIAAHAQRVGDKALSEKVKALQELVANSRDVEVPPGLTPDEAEVYKMIHDDLEKAKKRGSAKDADELTEFVKGIEESKVISAKAAKEMLKMIAAVRAMLPEKPPAVKEEPVDALLAELSGGSRGSVNQGPKLANGSTYPIGSHKLRFIAQQISGMDFDRASIDQKVNSLMSEARSNGRKTHVWDDAWLWISLPSKGRQYWICIAHDVTNGDYSWVAIQNTPAKWVVMRTNGDKFYVNEDTKRKFTTKFNGYTVDIDIQNPKNSGSWGGNDIWYGFGY